MYWTARIVDTNLHKKYYKELPKRIDIEIERERAHIEPGSLYNI